MHQLVNLVIEHGLLVVFLVTLLARIGAPLPAAPLLVIAGASSVLGQNAWQAVFIASIVANILGDGVWFLAGRKYGYRVLKLLCRISMSPDSCVRQSEGFITKWGGSSLIAAKFVPGVSIVAPPMAGALGMTMLNFLGFETLAAAIWTTLFMGLGAVFSGQVLIVLDLLSVLGEIAAVTLLVAAAIYLGWRWWRRRKFLHSVEMSRITVADLRKLIDSGLNPYVIDVRSDAGRRIDDRRIPGAMAIEMKAIKNHVREFPRDREIVLYCNCPNEATAATVALTLALAGFKKARPLAGGLDAWVEAGHGIDRHPQVVAVQTEAVA